MDGVYTLYNGSCISNNILLLLLNSIWTILLGEESHPESIKGFKT